MNNRLMTRNTLLSALLLTAACGQAPEISPGPRPADRQVSLHRVRAEMLPDYFEVSGNVRARNSAVLSAKVAGYVRAVHVREGQQVRSGQVLIEIEAPEIRSQNRGAEAGTVEAEQAQSEIGYSLLAARAGLTAAEAQARLAADTHARYKTLVEKESVSRQEYDEAEARHLAAQAQLEQARESVRALESRRQQVEARLRQARSQLETSQSYVYYLSLKAPFAGTVTRRSADPGTLAAPGLPLLTLEETAGLRLEVALAESLRWRVSPGSPIRVTVEAAGIKDLPAEPTETAAAADPVTRSFTFKLLLPESERLRLGMFGSARFPIGERQALRIPAASLLRQGQLEGVFIRDDDGIARWRLVKTGRTGEGQVEILSGLSEGDQVVQDPPAGLKAGDRLEVRP